MEILGLSKYLMVPLGALFIWFLVVKGSYRFVERILLVACLLYFGYVLSGFMAKPEWSRVMHATFCPADSMEC